MSRDIVPIMLGHAVTDKLFFTKTFEDDRQAVFTKTFDDDRQAVCKVFSYEKLYI